MRHTNPLSRLIDMGKKKGYPGRSLVRGTKRYAHRFLYSTIGLLVVVMFGFFVWYKMDPASYGEFIDKVVRPFWHP